MHAGQDPDLTLELPIVPPPSATSGETRPAIPSAPITPPRLMPMGAPAAIHRVSATLRFPGDLVHARANEFAQEARLAGAQHTLKLWRQCCHQALVALARVATAAPAGAVCEALEWQLDDEAYVVSATFALPAASVMH